MLNRQVVTINGSANAAININALQALGAPANKSIWAGHVMRRMALVKAFTPDYAAQGNNAMATLDANNYGYKDDNDPLLLVDLYDCWDDFYDALGDNSDLGANLGMPWHMDIDANRLCLYLGADAPDDLSAYGIDDKLF